MGLRAPVDREHAPAASRTAFDPGGGYRRIAAGDLRRHRSLLAELWTTVARSHLGLEPKVSALVYPVLYVAAAMLTLRAVLGDGLRGRRALPVQLVAFGVAAEAISFILWSSRMLEGT